MAAILKSVLAVFAVAAMPVSVAGAELPEYGIQSSSVSLSTTQAGAHPDLTVRLDVKTDPATGAAFAGTRDVGVDLPPGLVAAPSKFPTCPIGTFLASVALSETSPCPIDSQVGLINLGLRIGENVVVPEALYNLPPDDDEVARFGFFPPGRPTILDFRIGPEDGYRLHAELHGLPDFFLMNSAEAVVWGIPSDPAHDAQRLTPYESNECQYPCQAPGGSRPSDFPPIPLLTNPTWCGPAVAGFALTSYALPGETFEDSAGMPPIGGCERVPFAPAVDLSSTTGVTDSPSGIGFELRLPSDGFEGPDALVSSALQRLAISLPMGYALNPAAAAGLAACGRGEVGLLGADPAIFDDRPAICPPASKLGIASIQTPMLADALQGGVYLATPREDRSHSLVPLYLVAEGDGMVVKLRGRLVLDPGSGRVEVLFDELPPLPVSELSVDFGAGGDGLLTTPQTCGTHRGEVDISASSGAATAQPISLDTARGPGGAACNPQPFSPRLIAGTTAPVAGAPSPFVLRIDRAPGEQHLRQFEVALPRGLLPDVSDVATCAAAAGSAGTCPSSSRVGSASILAGAGSTPLRMPESAAAPAPVYLTGPEAGAPFGLVTSVPAQLGPFDLGRVVVRAAIQVNPRTAQVEVRSQPLPQVLDGVPIDYRRLRLELDRPGFIRNPTSCARSRIVATMSAVEGGRVSPSTSFQVGSCDRLRFHPRLSLGLRGAMGRGGHPALAIRLESPAGSESISRLSVLLPATELLDMHHIKDVCSRENMARRRCGRGSAYGRAAVSSPLFARPLRGPVRLRESRGRLPNLVASVHGEVGLDLVGQVESLRGRVQVTFGDLPDAPFRHLDLSLAGGENGLLVNTADLCRADTRATVAVTGQNGTRRVRETRLAPGCRQKQP